MTTTPACRRPVVLACSAAGLPRTLRLEPVTQPVASRDAAYRRLTAVILGLDVPTLARELRAARQRLTRTESRAA